MQLLASVPSPIRSALVFVCVVVTAVGCSSTEADVAWDPSEQPISEVLGHDPEPPDTTPLPTPGNSDIGIYCIPGADIVEIFQRNETQPDEIARLHTDANTALTAFRLHAGPDLRPQVDRLLWAIGESEAVFSLIGFDENRIPELDHANQARFEAAFDIGTMTALDHVARAVEFCPAVIEAGGVEDLLLDRFDGQDSVGPPRHPDEHGEHGGSAQGTTPPTSIQPPPNEASPTTAPPEPPSTTAAPEPPTDDGYEAIVDPAYCLAGTDSVRAALDTLSGLPTDPDVAASAFGLAWEGYALMEMLAPLESQDDVLWLWTGLTNAADILAIQYDYDIEALIASGDTVQIDGYQTDLSTAKLALAAALSIC